jgi:hypothetical protein
MSLMCNGASGRYTSTRSRVIGGMAVKAALVAMLGALAAVCVPAAHADADSYLAYLESHHINTALNSPSKNISAGFYACQALHAGQTPDQVAQSVPFSLADVRGMIEAAQHELCPDTLR